MLRVHHLTYADSLERAVFQSTVEREVRHELAYLLYC